jgi:hypothetical protein
MNKLIELFRWGYEGEYQQNFFVVNEEEEDKFIKDFKSFAKEAIIHSHFGFARLSFENFKHKDKEVNVKLIGHLEHLSEYYYYDDNSNNDVVVEKMSYIMVRKMV